MMRACGSMRIRDASNPSLRTRSSSHMFVLLPLGVYALAGVEAKIDHDPKLLLLLLYMSNANIKMAMTNNC